MYFSLINYSNIGNDTIDLSNVQNTLKTDSRNRVITSKAPTLEGDFPSKPLPPAHATNRTTPIIINKNRPQSAAEYTMYHNPNKTTTSAQPSNNNMSSTRQKLFTATSAAQAHAGMEEEKDFQNMLMSSNGSEKGKRPLSAPQHKQQPQPPPTSNFPSMNPGSSFNAPTLKHSNTANNAGIFNQSKNIVEQIYSAPYFKNTPSVPHPRVKSASYNRPSTTNSNMNSSSNNNASGQQMSAVDRALSIGKTLHLQQDGSRNRGVRRDSKGNSAALYLHGAEDNNNRAMKLNEMLEGNIIEKLDNVLAMNGPNNNNR